MYFLFLSNFHICGMLGDMFSSMLLGVFGEHRICGACPFIFRHYLLCLNKGNIRAVYKMLAVEVLLIVLCGLAQLIFGGGYQEGQTFKEIYETAGESGMGGGVIGGALVLALHKTVGATGSYILLLVFMILCLVCITERSFVMAVKKEAERLTSTPERITSGERRSARRRKRKNGFCGRSRGSGSQSALYGSFSRTAGQFTPDMAMPVTEEDLARFSADRKPEEKWKRLWNGRRKPVRRQKRPGGAESGPGHPAPAGAVPCTGGKGRERVGSGRCIPRKYHHGRKGAGKGDSSL